MSLLDWLGTGEDIEQAKKAVQEVVAPSIQGFADAGAALIELAFARANQLLDRLAVVNLEISIAGMKGGATIRLNQAP